MKNVVLLVFLFSTQVFAIQLKDTKKIDGNSVKDLAVLKCSFTGAIEGNKKILFLENRLAMSKLSQKHDQSEVGVYVNLYDNLGYNFHYEASKIHVLVEQEEVTIKKKFVFTKVPFKIQTPISMVIKKDNKDVVLKEVHVQCNG